MGTVSETKVPAPHSLQKYLTLNTLLKVSLAFTYVHTALRHTKKQRKTFDNTTFLLGFSHP